MSLISLTKNSRLIENFVAQARLRRSTLKVKDATIVVNMVIVGVLILKSTAGIIPDTNVVTTLSCLMHSQV